MRGEDPILPRNGRISRGSPPHARGRRRLRRQPDEAQGITPACAGKTKYLAYPFSTMKDHPRMRGEDAGLFGLFWGLGGSPPHARGRRCAPPTWRRRAGITPACAGKTSLVPNHTSLLPDHPRMRGEDIIDRAFDRLDEGSPPHARGRPRRRWHGLTGEGITPACAGKTVRFPRESGKIFFSLPVFFCSQPSPLGWFLRWVLGLGSSLWKQH